jgi:hypothetical protein
MFSKSFSENSIDRRTESAKRFFAAKARQAKFKAPAKCVESEAEGFNMIAGFLQADAPHLAKAFHNRLYKNIEGYSDFRRVTLEMAVLLQLLEDQPISATPLYNNPTLQSLVLVANRLKDFHAPLFFVEREFLMAASRTTPPGLIDWREMKMPFDAGIFVLPKDAMSFSDGSEIGHIAWARIRSGKHYVNRWNTFNSGNDFFMIVALSPKGYSLHHIVTDCYDAGDERLAVVNNAGELFSIKTTEDELATSQLLLRIVFNILKIMTVKPEVYEPGRYLRPHAKTAREVWTPHIIGKNYRVKRSAPRSGASKTGNTRTGYAQPLNWRMGHWRTQHFGAGFSESMEKWIEPYLAGGGLGKAA